MVAVVVDHDGKEEVMEVDQMNTRLLVILALAITLQKYPSLSVARETT